MVEQTKEGFLNILKNKFDFMAYCPPETKGVSRKVIEHKFNVKKERPSQ